MKWNRNEIAEIIGSIGAAGLIAGGIRYSLQGELLLFSKILLIAGAVLFIGGIVLGFKGIVKFFSRRSSQLGTNTAILAVAVLAILVVINFLGFRHHKRFDLTTEKLYTLSDQTKKIVGGLTQDVNIVRFVRQPPAQDSLPDLMSEYKNLNRHVKFQDVNPIEKPDVAKQYGATRLGDVIIASGTRKLPLEASPEGGYSEQDITSTIIKVTSNTVKMVCFVTGHDEKSLTSQDATGYSTIDDGLKRENYNTNSINLVNENSVPESCNVLVIAGPTKAYFPQETAMVSKFLDGGGKSLIEVDPETDPKLNDIFQEWNINVADNVVVDASGVGRLLGTGPETPLVVDYGDSPITKTLKGGMTFFPLARTVTIADKSKTTPEAVELLKTSQRSFTIPKLVHEVTFNPKTAGPLSLGVAANRTVDSKSARLVVLGNSRFAENDLVSLQENGDLFFNTIDWLAQDENMISIRPKLPTSRRITLTEAQATGLKWFELVFLPGIVVLVGITMWWKRR